jgi:hypothetical protein
LVAAFVNIGLGILFLTIGFNRPTVANMRPVDLLYVLGTGACLGVGLLLLVLSFVGRRTG